MSLIQKLLISLNILSISYKAFITSHINNFLIIIVYYS